MLAMSLDPLILCFAILWGSSGEFHFPQCKLNPAVLLWAVLIQKLLYFSSSSQGNFSGMNNYLLPWCLHTLTCKALYNYGNVKWVHLLWTSLSVLKNAKYTITIWPSTLPLRFKFKKMENTCCEWALSIIYNIHNIKTTQMFKNRCMDE